MGASKKTRKFGAVKRIIGQRDARLLRQDNRDIDEKKKATEAMIRQVPQVSSSLFFQYNTALVPPYSVLIDTNFLSLTVQRKLPLLESMMDTLFAKCVPVVTSCGQHSLRPFSPSSLHTNADTLMIKSWPSWRNWVPNIESRFELPEMKDGKGWPALIKAHTPTIALSIGS
jgi:hypothetical protein